MARQFVQDIWSHTCPAPGFAPRELIPIQLQHTLTPHSNSKPIISYEIRLTIACTFTIRQQKQRSPCIMVLAQGPMPPSFIVTYTIKIRIWRNSFSTRLVAIQVWIYDGKLVCLLIRKFFETVCRQSGITDVFQLVRSRMFVRASRPSISIAGLSTGPA